MIRSSQVPVEQEERLVSYLPLSHIAGISIDIYGAIYVKAVVTFADEKALQGSLGITLKEARPTFFFAVPRVFEKIEEKIRAIGASNTGIKKSIGEWAKRVGYESTLKQINGQPTSFGYSVANSLIFNKIREGIGLDQCKMILVGAAPISKSCLDYFLSLNIKLYNVYGMSECSAPASINGPRTLDIYSAGSVFPGTELVIKGPNGETLPFNKKGEVCFRGRNKFMGYYKNEKDTKETIDKDGFIHSGDEGILKNGVLYITGRFKELIITAGGENIPPILIEDAVKERAKIVSNAFLIGDGKKYLSILISFHTLQNPDGSFSYDLTPEVISFVASLGITAKTVQDLIKNPRTGKFIENVIETVNKKSTSRAQEIRKFRFIEDDFSIKGGELTPTMKVKRKVVLEKYAALINEIYNDPKL